MADPVTNNVSLTLPTIGGDVGTWGTPLNGDITTIDALFGASFSTAITNADVTLTTTQFQNGVFVVTGTLTGNHNLIIPFSTNFLSTTCCGGKFVVVNNGAGAFNLSVKTATTGTSVTVPQGFAANLFSDGANVKLASDNLPGYAKASNGNPNGSLSGTAGSVNTNASLAWDYTNTKLYASLGGTSWTTVLPVITLTYASIAAQLLTPDIQVFTSGSSATYTTATNGSNRPLYLLVRMVGGGGGGAAANTNNGSSGGDSSFASWTAVHGAGGTTGGPAGTAGSGGSNSTGTLIRRLAGANGGPGTGTAAGSGGASAFGGAGVDLSFAAGNGVSATANSGSGGAGAAQSSAGGGGAGEYVEFIITSPAATYTYTVGASGAGGAAGGNSGGNGGAGRIEVIGYWQ